MRPGSGFLRQSQILVPAARQSSICRVAVRRTELKSHDRRTPARLSSTSVSNEPANDSVASSPQNPSEDGSSNPPPPEDSEKTTTVVVRRRQRREKEVVEEPVTLPEDLAILWTDFPEEPPDALPPPVILSENINNLRISLQPKVQYSAATESSPEPSLGIYCLLEGGHNVVDATVKEMARHTGADVVVIDAIQLASGEFGEFGSANNLVFSPNPLHFTESSAEMPQSPRRRSDPEESVQDAPSFIGGTIQLLTRQAKGGQGMMSERRARSASQNKIKAFFDAVVNIAPKDSPPEDSPRPRLIYIRDYPTIAESSDVWYPALLSSVQTRRRNSIYKSNTPVLNPTTIVFGMSPPIHPSSSKSDQPSPPVGLLQILARNNGHVSAPVRPSRTDYGESEAAERAREKRLMSRLRKWERGESSLFSEFPSVPSGSSAEDRAAESRPSVVVIDSRDGAAPFPSVLPTSRSSSSSDDESNFFRSSIIVPRVRSLHDEREWRTTRRRQINELSIRMGIGAVGGTLENTKLSVLTETVAKDDEKDDEPNPSTETSEDSFAAGLREIREDWGQRIENWSTIRQISDRAFGIVVASLSGSWRLESTPIPWRAVTEAFSTHRGYKDLRRAWVKDVTSVSRTSRENEDDDEEDDEEYEDTDDVVERIRNDPELDSHEQRLLSCIVNTEAMPTTFDQVHLPMNTIDSIRTIVSLPLLHPDAFQTGILKEHGINGALLFGPPGTGKTLVVRALAREAGCRMMVVAPSDVMDMYVGEGEKMVKAVFSLARKLSPCIIFLDEIDAILGARVSRESSGGAFAHRGVITEFMQELDGLMTSREDSVVVIGATNRPGDLDDAVLRRLPRRLLIDLPGEREREAILRIMLREETLGLDVDVASLARMTESFSGSDLKHLCVSAALDAVKESHHVPWLHASYEKQTEVIPGSAKQTDGDGSTSESSEPSKHDEAETPQQEANEDSSDANPVEETTVESSKSNRILSFKNFSKSLQEITPSSSENLGSLADLRKWNEEFGEGRKDRKRRQVWGKDKFGFTVKVLGRDDPRVLIPEPVEVDKGIHEKVQ